MNSTEMMRKLIETSTRSKKNEQVKNKLIKSKAQWVDKTIGAICGTVGMGILAYILSATFPQIF